MSLDFLSNEEIVMAARRNLPNGPWAYLSGGVESETSMRRNRLAFDRIAFRPRVLVDVSEIDPSTTFLGHKLRIPVFPAPVGSLEVFHPEGAAGSNRAAAEFGTIHAIATVTQPGLDQVVACGAPTVFQLYVNGDRDWVKSTLTHAKELGCIAICLTVDVAYHSRRERHMLSRWSQSGGTTRAMRGHRPMVTWETMDMIRDITGLPFMVKGIQTAEDAVIAVEHGVDVIWVSNHGGRQLDHALGTIDTLPEVVQAVQGRAAIVLDSGIQRGTDVLKAIALGANAVAIGKLQGWGLAAAGGDGVKRVLEILEDEIRVSMGLLGVTKLSQLNENYLCKAESVTPPHEMSGWANMPGGRLL